MNKKLKKMIDYSNVISFDIFDTLIVRYVHEPKYIFKLIEDEYKRKEKFNLNFVNYRILAEQSVRNENKGREITLDEIYYYFKEKNILSDYDINNLLNIEKDFEKRFTVKNYDFKDIYNYCIKSRKRIIITSDMYLDKDTIIEILQKEDIKYDEIYLSSELKLSKDNGNLFDYIVKCENCNPEKILHIGDNIYSDYKNPKRKGLNAFRYINKKRYDKYCNNNYEKIHKCIIQKYNYEKINYWERIGFENIGVLYYGFITWLINQIKYKEIEHVYFFSRDGYILKKIYDKITKDVKMPRSTYFYTSRRAINIPMIDKMNDNTLKMLKTGINKTSMKSFLIKIGLNEEEIRRTLNRFDININMIIDSIKDDDLVNRIILFNKNIILENAKKEKEILKDYIKQNSINKYKKIAIVDIGWNGTMQISLENLLDSLGMKSEVYGFYIGTNKTEMNKNNNKMKGYVYSNNIPIRSKIILRGFNAFIEELFIAPHGSVIGYERKNNRISPIFENFEYDEKQYKILNNIQIGAIKYVEEITKINGRENYFNIEGEFAIKSLKRLIFNPTLEEAKNIGELYHFDYVKNYNAKPNNSLVGYIINYREFIKDYKKALWKIGFMRQLTKINLSKIFELIHFMKFKYIKE